MQYGNNGDGGGGGGWKGQRVFKHTEQIANRTKKNLQGKCPRISKLFCLSS